MNISLFGYKLNVKYILIAVVLYFIITSLTVASCSKVSSIEEGMALMDYKMGEGVQSSWETRDLTEDPTNFRSKEHDAFNSELIQPESGLSFFGNTQFKPECCGSNYASSGGCACMSKTQMDYINTRGGNRTQPGF